MQVPVAPAAERAEPALYMEPPPLSPPLARKYIYEYDSGPEPEPPETPAQQHGRSTWVYPPTLDPDPLSCTQP